MEDEDGAVLRRESPECPLDLIPVDDHVAVVRQLVHHRDPAHGRGLATPPARLAVGGVDQHAPDPGLEPVGVAQAIEVAPTP